MADSCRTPHRARQFITTSNLLRIFVAMSLLFIVNFATWNVCGLSDADKQHIAGFDSERYGLDIVAIQETKVCDFSETILPNGYKLFMFKQTTSVHGGLGFIISKRFIPYVCSWTQISDRVVYQSQNAKRASSQKRHMVISIFLLCNSLILMSIGAGSIRAIKGGLDKVFKIPDRLHRILH